MKFILTGANTGKTEKFSHVKFVNGIGEWPGPIDKMAGLINVLASFNAYPAGSKELEAAQKRDKEFANGPSAILSGQGRGAESGLETDKPASGEASGSGATGVEVPAAGSEANGSGEEAGRLASQSQDPKTLKVIDAIKLLNPDESAHWSEDGLPLVAIVAELSGVIEVSRKDIETAMPGYNRAKALAEMAANI